MKKPPLVLAVLLWSMVSSLPLVAQEICNNGKDDDGNGFIDCYDKGCATSTFCKDFYLGEDPLCEVVPNANPDFTMQSDFVTPDETANHLGRVVVGDLDRDGIPEMVTVNRFSKKILILNGRDGSIKRSITTSFSPGYEEIAIANIDNDDCAEIFIIDTSWRLYSYDCNLNLKWGPVALPGDPGMFGLADFNGDGSVELYVRDAIYNAHTGSVLIASSRAGNQDDFEKKINGGPVAVDILPHPSDPAKNDDLELVVGCKIYSVNLTTNTLTLIKELPEYYIRAIWNATSVADFNLDGYLDVIASGSTVGHGENTTIFFWDVHNNTHKTYEASLPAGHPDNNGGKYTKGWSQGTGRINIANIDADTLLNLSFVSGKFLFALDENLNLKWRKVINEETSGYTGCTLFDFNGDGKSEIVYRDERFLYILDGTDGSIHTQQVCVSRTNREYPIVADVDADGQTELCVTCRTVDFYPGTDGSGNSLDQIDFSTIERSRYSQVRVFRTAADPWVPARRVWNQHGYFNVNVNDDLSIPAKQQKHHRIFSVGKCSEGANRPLNSFLNQSPFLNIDGCPSYKAPNLAPVANSLTIDAPTCPERDFTVSFKFTNIGDIKLSGDLPITFYNGDPTQPNAIKLNTITVPVPDLGVGDTATVTNATVNGPGSPFTLFVVLNDNGTTVPTPIQLPNTDFFECNYDDNILQAPVTPLPLDVTAVNVKDNIKCDPASQNNGAVRAYVSLNGVENTTDFDFYWSNGGTAKPVPADKIGSTYTKLAEGEYTVYAIHKTAQCNTNEARVTVALVNKTITATVIPINENENCVNPNGRLRVVVNDTDNDGVGDDPDNFTYTWYEGNDIFVAPEVGINDTVTNLKAGTYTVLVVDKFSGCRALDSYDVTAPQIPTVSASKVDILCSNAASGSASATVGNNTTNYFFRWYNGTAVKPSYDFEGSTYSGLTAGSYTVVAVHKTTECASAPVTVSIVQSPPITVTAAPVDAQTSCDLNAPNGSGSASVNGTTTGYTFAWFSGQNTLPANQVSSNAVATGLNSGVYTVKATSTSTGCTNTAEITIQDMVGPVDIINVNTQAATTCAPNDGQIEVNTLSPGSPADYDFLWFNGSSEKATSDYPANTTNVLTGIPAGTYTVKAIHKTRKCHTPARTVTINLSAPSISASLSDIALPNDCTSDEGFLEVTVSTPNTNGYSFTWFEGGAAIGTPLSANPGDLVTPPNRSKKAGLKAGNYTVEITNLDNGCKTAEQFVLNFVNAHQLNPVNQENILDCVPQGGSITVELTNEVPGTNYALEVYQSHLDLNNGQAGTTILPNTPYTTPNPLDPTHYTLVAVAMDGPTVGCRIARTFKIEKETSDPEVDGSLTAASMVTNNMCNSSTTGVGNGEITLEGPGISSNPTHYDYSWSNGATTRTNTGLAAGTYTVRVTYNNNSPVNRGCFTDRTFTILNDLEELSVDRANGDIDFSHVMSCDPADGITPLAQGSAFFTEIKEGTNAVTNFSGYNFNWREADNTPVPADGDVEPWNVMNVLAPGDYIVTATNTSTNCEATVAFTIENGTLNTTGISLTSFTRPTTCYQPNVTGRIEVIATGGGAAYAYEWFEGANTAGDPLGTNTGNTAGANNEIAENLDPGDYTVKVTNTTNQCIAVEKFTLPLDTKPVIVEASSSPLTVCYESPDRNGSVFAAVANVPTGWNYNYNWYEGDVDDGTPDGVNDGTPDFTTNTVTNLPGNPAYSQGNVEYVVVAVDANDPSCTGSAKVTVRDLRKYPAVTAQALLPNAVCADHMAKNGAAVATVNDNIIDYDFHWYNTTPPSGPSFYTGSHVSTLNTGTYSVVAENIFTGCTATTQVTIDFNPLPVPSPEISILSHVTSCVDDNGALSASVDGNTRDYTFEWYDGKAEYTPAAHQGEFYYDLATGFYSVIATSTITGCRSPLVSEEIIAEPVYPTFNWDIMPASCNEANGYAAVFLTNDVELGTIVWDVNGETITGPLLANVPVGTYRVTVTSALGCSRSEDIHINTDVRPFNGISRNGDDQNAIFYINCIENFPSNIVKIFNRVGTLVYEAEGYDNADTFFDGKSNKGISLMGTNLPTGTYFYIVDKRDGSKPLAGYLEIVN